MAKKIPDAILDAMLAVAQGDRVFICSAEPATYAEASSAPGSGGYMLAQATVNTGTDYTKAAGDVSGRKNTLAAKNGVTISNTGSATHVVVANSGDSTIKRITTCTAQTLTAGGGATVDIGASVHEILAPS